MGSYTGCVLDPISKRHLRAADSYEVAQAELHRRAVGMETPIAVLLGKHIVLALVLSDDNLTSVEDRELRTVAFERRLSQEALQPFLLSLSRS